MASLSKENIPPLKKSSPGSMASKTQKSILGFFQKKSAGPLQPQVNGVSTSETVSLPIGSPEKKSVQNTFKFGQDLTPAPSSDAVLGEEDDEDIIGGSRRRKSGFGPPSPITPASSIAPDASFTATTSSPIRKARKSVDYAESNTEDDDGAVVIPQAKKRRLKRRKTVEESEDDYAQDEDEGIEEFDEDDFIVADESEDEAPKRKRKRSSQEKQARSSSPVAPRPSSEDEDLEIPTVSTAQQWVYDPENIEPRASQPVQHTQKSSSTKQKAHMTEPEQRYTWLANVQDADRHPVGHPDYDTRTIYIPPMAWTKFSAFEKQYWEIKKNLWDTIVFFKKGKFYELYEHDATIGHQLFDLKLTDRVNMRMVGVPEMSLDHWAAQFIAKGYKIARVDQKETALGKEMREREAMKKEDKVIHRELSCILTSGTLVDGGMLQDDMSTFCVAIKESIIDDMPQFGIAFVDAATGQFFLSQFKDDQELTRFETFIAQTRPQELLLDKASISTKALRILKNNTSPTTLWNYLKPGKEFWEADITRREIDAQGYFTAEDEEEGKWPEPLQGAREQDDLMSAMGALIYYLRVLKMDRELISLGNFTWYDPIKKASSLVLDGQTLINLEIFTNSFDGSPTGTLFSLLNRCVTPFGKRMFKMWVCHPLMDASKINARLDAVDALNADPSSRDQFASSLTKLPDLERLLSRIYASSCKAQDFVRVLEGFEQIEYTMGLLGASGSGEGLIGQLVSSLPDLASMLKPWKTAFDHSKAKDHGIVYPEPGVESDFDESQAHVEAIHAGLDKLLKKTRKDLGSNAIVYRDNGKEIYQLEVSGKVKGAIPSTWDQMSATKQVKRYYSPELRKLVRELQEAQETHGQIVKEVLARFLARFAEQYMTWLTAVKVVAQLDCLIGLAKASSSLGQPSCRPEFVDGARGCVEFTELRHPCMLSSGTDFIPNDVSLGGEHSTNISLLTGANAAGKSTVLRMTCVATIMAQIGCYVPAQSARLAPVDRIMSRLGANDNIFAAQSTFFVELAETKKILSEATPRSLVILDELGRGTSSYDGVAVAQAVLHHVATHVGCIGFFATHYHSLADEFAGHPEICAKRMKIHVDAELKRVTFLYKLEDGVAEGSFGMHCAAMCGIPTKVIERAEEAAKAWEHTSRLKESLLQAKTGCYVPLGVQSDVAWVLRGAGVEERGLEVLMKAIEGL